MTQCAPFTVTVLNIDAALAEMQHDCKSFAIIPDGAMFSVAVGRHEVSGVIKISGNSVTVTILQKPWWMPCDSIEAYVQKLVAGDHVR